MTLSTLETKDPDEVKDYSIDWTGALDAAEDTILSSLWLVAAGITKDTDTFDDVNNKTTIWLSGGTLGTNYPLTNRIVTVGGRTLDQSITIRVRAR